MALSAGGTVATGRLVARSASISCFLVLLAPLRVSGVFLRGVSVESAQEPASPLQGVLGTLAQIQSTVQIDLDTAFKIYEKCSCDCQKEERASQEAMEQTTRAATQGKAVIEELQAEVAQLEQELSEHADNTKATRDSIEEARVEAAKSEAELKRNAEIMQENLAKSKRAIGALHDKLEKENPGSCACRSGKTHCLEESTCEWLPSGTAGSWGIGNMKLDCNEDVHVESSQGWTKVPVGADQAVEITSSNKGKFSWKCGGNKGYVSDCGDGNLLVMRSSSRRRFNVECKSTDNFRCDSSSIGWTEQWGAEEHCEKPGESAFNTEGDGVFCGSVLADKKYMDLDATACKKACKDRPDCKGFATYAYSKCDRCALYVENDCSADYQQPTTCDGTVTAYSKIVSGAESNAPGAQLLKSISALEQTVANLEEDIKETAYKLGALQSSTEALIATKQKDLTLWKNVDDSKKIQLGQLKVETAAKQKDVDFASKQLEADRSFMEAGKEECARRLEELRLERKERTEELQAVTEASKILSESDAQDLFQEIAAENAIPIFLQTQLTRRSAAFSFIQVLAPGRATTLRALQVMQEAVTSNPDVPALRQIAVTASAFVKAGAKSEPHGFDKVLDMVAQMIYVLISTQSDEDAKKAYCQSEIEKANGEQQKLMQEMETKTAQIESDKDQIIEEEKELKEIESRLADFEQAQKDMELHRRQESGANADMRVKQRTAAELVLKAENRLHEFYHGDTITPPVLGGVSSAQLAKLTSNIVLPSSTLAPAGPAPEVDDTLQSLALLGQADTMTSDAAGLANADSFKSYFSANDEAPALTVTSGSGMSTAGEDSSLVLSSFLQTESRTSRGAAVLQLLEQVRKDLLNGVEELTSAEAKAQLAFQKHTEVYEAKLRVDRAAVVEKRLAMASSQQDQERAQKFLDVLQSQLAESKAIQDSLHEGCDPDLAAYDERRARRAAEIKSLEGAKLVLER